VIVVGKNQILMDGPRDEILNRLKNVPTSVEQAAKTLKAAA
jgi:hypothetical protein